ncbi:cytochrome c oxidase subunit VIb [Athelia psychrophila]|uniref:Cytochrome c oxidase subunit n=1 Tax=Athelia psychrophila TaxID=1759441 RepID=A0A166QLT3_9AGAM|nr:cytochrome c oxidase subunit VIb [Fibularhizoctonia sp. CBS 109695]
MSEEGQQKYILQTAGFDARFPNTNQTRHCFQNYTDYFKCIAAKGDDYAPCKQFKRAYNSLCPSAYLLLIEKWDDQRENGTFPANLDP